MKRFCFVALFVALCGAGFAGGELPARIPAQNFYAQPAPAPVTFWTRAGNYGKNVWYGTTYAVGGAVSTVVYTGTLGAVDLCKQAEYQPGFWN